MLNKVELNKVVKIARDAGSYSRLASTIEWDAAGAHAVVLESGKHVVQFEKDEALVYNKENLLNPWFIVKE